MKKTISFRPYILVIMLIVVLFVISTYLLVGSVESYIFKILETQYINYASIYSHELTKTAEASLIINDMLERRIMSSIRTIALYSDQITNESLADLADTLAVDEIYLFNPDGEIEYSTYKDYLGWRATPGHPVHDFMISQLPYHVEEIRQDTESDKYYKYGYYMLEDGRFVQLGIQAEIVNMFLAPFEIQHLLQEMGNFDLVDYVYFVHNDYSIDACCDPRNLDLQMDNPEILQAIESRTTYSLRRFSEAQNGEVYEIFIPIYVSEDYGGTLVVAKNTDEADSIVQTTIILCILLSAVVFASFIYIMFANYRHNKSLATLAYQDGLTGLPNRAHFTEMLNEELTQPLQGKHAILMIHCRSLIMINSTYGFEVGDRVIKELALKLEEFITDDRKHLFRFASNRFVLYVQDYKTKDELALLATNILNKLEPSLEIIGRPIEVGIGIVEFTSNLTPDDVLSQASMALQHLEQKQSQVGYALFDAEIEEKLRREEIIAQEMAAFLTNPGIGTMHLEYQPKVTLATNKIVGFEALSRMMSPSLGRVSPLEFISIAERQEMIIPLGYWALEEACRFIKRLASEGYDQVYVAVNISVIQLLQEDFPSRVEAIVTKAGIDPQNLQLEITESVLIEDFDDIQAKLLPLRDLGLTIALDDFGTGYSALSRMGELPVDYIKIDKSFVDKILVEDDQTQIIKEIIAMCHKLNLKVVAEGVEHEKQRDYLLASSCDLMQGYLYSKPLAEDLALQKMKQCMED